MISIFNSIEYLSSYLYSVSNLVSNSLIMIVFLIIITQFYIKSKYKVNYLHELLLYEF